ncbi:MAG: MazG family protein [Verrucomicrobiota bacterium]|nr:MazG family protein [Verrucomicrobiota bacterium]
MSRLRAPDGCPWDKEQDHESLKFHAVEEVYELIDAIEAGDDHEMQEELGDLLLQVIFHCQLAKERKVFDFNAVCQTLAKKLTRRHPHVFGDTKADDIDEVWANWEKIKRAEKEGTHLERHSAMDGIPKHLPALQYAEKLAKKARKAKLIPAETPPSNKLPEDPALLGESLLELAMDAQSKGWSAEALLRRAIQKKEKGLRDVESK